MADMQRYLVSVRVTKHGKFRKTHLARINAPTPDEALRHLKNRCAPGGEYARKFPGTTFSEFEALDSQLERHLTAVASSPLPLELVYE